MDVRVNERTISKALNDEKFKAELIEYLNSVVDEELEKGEHMNTDLITDCTEMIFELENGYETISIENKVAEKIVKFCHKKTVNKNRTRQIAAVIALIMIAHTATYYSFPAYADAVDRFTQQIFDLLDGSSKETDDGSDEYSYIHVEKPKDFNENINSVEEATLDGCKVYAVPYDKVSDQTDPVKDGVEIPLSQCRVEKQVMNDNNQKMVIISVSYKGNTDLVRYYLNEGE